MRALLILAKLILNTILSGLPLLFPFLDEDTAPERV